MSDRRNTRQPIPRFTGHRRKAPILRAILRNETEYTLERVRRELELLRQTNPRGWGER